MGYFSNGTEGDMYEAEYCDKCHFRPVYEPGPGEDYKDCPILTIHSLFNYDQHGKDERAKDLKLILTELIPMRPGDIFSDRCNFFLEKARHEQTNLLDYREWSELPEGK